LGLETRVRFRNPAILTFGEYILFYFYQANKIALNNKGINPIHTEVILNNDKNVIVSLARLA